ncbi:MAG: flagellar protein FlaG [Alphaproteobacteria bacterium]
MELGIGQNSVSGVIAGPRPAPVADRATAATPAAVNAAKPESDAPAVDLQARLSQALRDGGTLLDQHNLELDIDQNTGRTVGRIVSADTGEVLVQIPSKEMLALIARIRDALGPLVDEQV